MKKLTLIVILLLITVVYAEEDIFHYEQTVKGLSLIDPSGKAEYKFIWDDKKNAWQTSWQDGKYKHPEEMNPTSWASNFESTKDFLNELAKANLRPVSERFEAGIKAIENHINQGDGVLNNVIIIAPDGTKYGDSWSNTQIDSSFIGKFSKDYTPAIKSSTYGVFYKKSPAGYDEAYHPLSVQEINNLGISPEEGHTYYKIYTTESPVTIYITSFDQEGNVGDLYTTPFLYRDNVNIQLSSIQKDEWKSGEAQDVETLFKSTQADPNRPIIYTDDVLHVYDKDSELLFNYKSVENIHNGRKVYTLQDGSQVTVNPYQNSIEKVTNSNGQKSDLGELISASDFSSSTQLDFRGKLLEVENLQFVYIAREEFDDGSIKYTSRNGEFILVDASNKIVDMSSEYFNVGGEVFGAHFDNLPKNEQTKILADYNAAAAKIRDSLPTDPAELKAHYEQRLAVAMEAEGAKTDKEPISDITNAYFEGLGEEKFKELVVALEMKIQHPELYEKVTGHTSKGIPPDQAFALFEQSKKNYEEFLKESNLEKYSISDNVKFEMSGEDLIMEIKNEGNYIWNGQKWVPINDAKPLSADRLNELGVNKVGEDFTKKKDALNSAKKLNEQDVKQLKSNYQNAKAEYDKIQKEFSFGSGGILGGGKTTATLGYENKKVTLLVKHLDESTLYTWNEQEKRFVDAKGQKLSPDFEKQFGLDKKVKGKFYADDFKEKREKLDAEKKKYESQIGPVEEGLAALRVKIVDLNKNIESINKQQRSIRIDGSRLEYTQENGVTKITAGDKIFLIENNEIKTVTSTGQEIVLQDQETIDKIRKYLELQNQKETDIAEKEKLEKEIKENPLYKDQEKERQKRIQREQLAYELTWQMLNLVLEEFAFGFIDDSCREDWRASEPALDEPITTNTGATTSSSEPIELGEGEEYAQQPCELNQYHAEIQETAEGYALSYAITACESNINYNIELKGPTAPLYSIVTPSNSVAQGITYTGATVITNLPPNTYDRICIRITGSQRCFPE